MSNQNKNAIRKAAAKAGARKADKKLAKSLGAKVHERTGGSDNPYLKCLVNPEQWQSAYPDNYGEKTAVCKFVTNRAMTWDANGNYWVCVNPTLPDHVLTMQPSQAAGLYGYSSETRFYPKPVTIKTGPGEYLNLNSLVGPKDSNGREKLVVCTNTTFQLPAMTAQGDLYLNTPDTGITWTVLWDDNTTNFITPGVAFAIGAARKTFAINASCATSVATVTSVKISIAINEPAGVQSRVQLPCQNYSDLVPAASGAYASPAPIFEEYRVVGMSALITYEGDTLYNGGNCTGRVVSGGDSAVSLNWLGYDSIASLPDSYEGPLTMGAYGFWVPTDTKDMQFRDCDTVNTNGDLPALVFAGIVKNPSNAVIRLRTCLVVEAKTYKPYISTTYSLVAPQLIDAAAVALRGIPRIMENPLHLQDIQDFLRKVVDKGKAAWEFGKAAAPVVLPVAQALGSMVL